MNTKKLTGTYKLIKHGRVSQEGEFIPTSEAISGELKYNTDSSMSVIITTVDKPESVNQLICYQGTFSIEDDKIIHHISRSIRSEQNGTDQVRDYSIENNEIQLSASVEGKGEMIARWKRV